MRWVCSGHAGWLRRRRAQTLAGAFLHQMHALGLTETEIETLLRETAQQQTEE